MPQRGNIEQYTAPTDRLQPSEETPAVVSRGAIHIAQMNRESGDVYKQGFNRVIEPVSKIIDEHETREDISEGAATGAALYNNMMDEWNKILTDPATDPHDKSVQQKFLNDRLEPALQQYQSAFTTEKGQNWGLTRADEMRQHFFERTSADMMNRAGNAQILDAKTTLDQLSSAAYKNPSSVDYAMSHVDAYLQGIKQNGTWDAQTLDKFDAMAHDAKNEIAKATVKSIADGNPGTGRPGNPQGAVALLNSGKLDSYMNGDEKSQLVSYAEAQKVAHELARQQAQQAATYKQQQINEQGTKSIFAGIAAGQTYSATTALSDAKLSPQQRVDFVSSDLKNPGILRLPQSFLTSTQYGPKFAETMDALRSGYPVTPAGLTAGVRRKEITPAGAARLQEVADQMKTADGAYEVKMQNEVLQQMYSHLVKGGPNASDPKGKAIYNDMQSSFYALWDSEIKSGKTPAQLANPDSKDYIGNAFMTLKRPDAQALSDVISARPEPATKTEPVKLVPMEKREVGKTTINTPRGVMVWSSQKDENGNVSYGWAPKKSKE